MRWVIKIFSKKHTTEEEIINNVKPDYLENLTYKETMILHPELETIDEVIEIIGCKESDADNSSNFTDEAETCLKVLGLLGRLR